VPDLPSRTKDVLALLALSEPGLSRLPFRTARVAARVARGAAVRAATSA
jgi:hypothetical protein